jgi:pimeloyl-ACP methyl ester carboxylesterase
MNKNTFALQVDEGLVVNGDIYSTTATAQPILIISHGFKAYREWGFFPYMAEQYAQSGMIVINIDFSQNGVVDAEKGIFDADVFRTVTVSQEINDLNAVIDNLKYLLNEYSIEGWNGEVFLLGHSLGGAVSVITASQRNDISKVVTWGSIGDIDRNTQRQKDDWRAKGVLEFENRITGQMLYLDVEYLEDKLRNKEKYDLEKCISELDIPTLIVHGDKDFTVRMKEAKMLDNAAKNSELCIINKANHTFNCRHPFTVTNEILDQAINSTIEFLKK